MSIYIHILYICRHSTVKYEPAFILYKMLKISNLKNVLTFLLNSPDRFPIWSAMYIFYFRFSRFIYGHFEIFPFCVRSYFAFSEATKKKFTLYRTVILWQKLTVSLEITSLLIRDNRYSDVNVIIFIIIFFVRFNLIFEN